MLKKLIMFVLFAGLVIYIGILYGTPYYHYYGFNSDIEELAVLKNLQIKEIRKEIKESINYYDVPVKMSSVLVEKLPTYEYRISVSWKETVNFLDLYERNYKFSINVNGSDL